MCMLEIVIEGILNNHNKIDSLTKYTKTMNDILCTGLVLSGISIYKLNKKIRKQNTQISELKKELEEIKTKGE